MFDGDVDAVWVENMNSVMDDNKLLTLPNGERIRLQPHCRLLFEVHTLQTLGANAWGFHCLYHRIHTLAMSPCFALSEGNHLGLVEGTYVLLTLHKVSLM